MCDTVDKADAWDAAVSVPPKVAREMQALRDENAKLRAALRDVRHEICVGPVDDTLWHRAFPSETTVDFITNTLNDGWDYDSWFAEHFGP